MFSSTVFFLLYVFHYVTAVPNGTLEPRFNHVLEGTSAVFTCNVTGRDPDNEKLAWRGFYGGQLAWGYPGTTTESFNIHKVTQINYLKKVRFGKYSVKYAGNVDSQEILQLRISNVTKNDGSFLFYCIYICVHTHDITPHEPTTGSIGVVSNLTVWTKTSTPKCSSQGHIPDVISNHEKHEINLTCSLQGGDPPPYLTWHAADSNGSIIAGPEVREISIIQNITSSDLGRMYFCRAEIKAIPNNPLICSIIPNNSLPIVSVTSSKPIYSQGSMVSIFCNNSGAYTPDTTYLWYINKTFVNVSHLESVEISKTNAFSALHIRNATFLTNNTKITCEVEIAMIVRANASLIVTFDVFEDIRHVTDYPLPQTVTESTIKNEPTQETMLLIKIIVVAAGGGFGIIILVLLVYFICIKCKRASKKYNKCGKTDIKKVSPSKQRHSNQSIQRTRNEQVQSNPLITTPNKRNKPENNSFQSKESANEVLSGIPVYALPNKGKKTHAQDESSDIPIYALPNKNKDGIDKESSSSHANRKTVTENKDADKMRSTAEKNAEGLIYADLEITQSVHENGLSNDVVRTESSTIYSEVKV